MSGGAVRASLSPDRAHMDVRFPYDPGAVHRVKLIAGARFVPRDRGGPLWRLPLDLTTGRLLREAFGDQLLLDDDLTAWGRLQLRRERNLHSMATADDWDPADMRITQTLPSVAAVLRPYQRADIKVMSEVNVINGNDMGLGKTLEVLGSIWEAGLENGRHLIVAPRTSLLSTWAKEIDKWLPEEYQVWYTLSGDVSAAERAEYLADIEEAFEADLPLFVIITASMLRQYAGSYADKDDPKSYQPGFFENHRWSTFTIDEFHKMGLTNASGDARRGTAFAQTANRVKADRRWALSGTPIGGKPIKLWGALHWKQPDLFTSKWKWAQTWLEIEDNGFGKTIGALRPEREAQFYREHAHHMIRRLKSEVVPELPPKQYVDVWCDMTPKQAKQYRKFAKAAELQIGDNWLNATNVLAEMARLKMFATAYCEAVERPDGSLKLKPVMKESGKVAHLIELLAQQGITNDEDATGDNIAVVASQHKQTIDALCDYLNEIGIQAEKITGGVTGRDRQQRIADFQAGKIRVICLTTTAGGVSIELDRADNIYILDETWDPDDQTQLEDRVHRASRIHQVTCYYLRSTGTVDLDIRDLVIEKGMTNKQLLDTLRNEFKQEIAA